MSNLSTVLFSATLAFLYSSCGGTNSAHFSLPHLVAPEDAKAVLGGDVGPVGFDGLGDLEDKGNMSWQTNCRYETTTPPKRMIRIQGWSWEKDQASAEGQYTSQRDRYIAIPDGANSEKIEGLGDEAIAYRGNTKKDTALLVRQGKKVVSLHITGGVAPDDQVAKLKTLTEKILAVPAK